MAPFDPTRVAVFSAISWTFDPTSGEARFEYGLDEIRFLERISFPLPPGGLPSGPVTDARLEVAHRLLAQLFVAAGVSYYKAAAPPVVRILQGSYTEDEIAFHRLVLAKGLGEYSWVNGLDPELSPRFEFDLAPADHAPVAGLNLDRGPLVPVGGGKDSCVTVEALRDGAVAPTIITVNRYPVIQDVIDASGLADLLVRRAIAPELIALNRDGARNGHVPITTIVSLCVLITAALHGHEPVVMSNERSASEGNVVYRGVEINHQWSKSVELESAMQRLLASITPELHWFSLLRPLSELAIVERFARTCGRYFDVFSSCNAAFRLDPTRRVTRWCRTCPKCQFVYLALATTLDRGRLESIFCADLFTSSPPEGFEALLGLTGWKPFECVGESGECRVALRLVADRAGWAGHPVVAALAARVRSAGAWPSDAEVSAALGPDPGLLYHLPPEYRALVG